MEMPRMEVKENAPLAPLTTLGVGGNARFFVRAESIHDVEAAVAFSREKGRALFVLGGGSNVVVSDRGWDGLVLQIAIPGIDEHATSRFNVGAGIEWDTFVAHAVSRNYSGIECLSGIPGSVGGTPIQNVGAYGQEVSQTISYVRVLEISTGEIIELTNAECGFRYRSSIFNTTQRGRYIVLQVTYHLELEGEPHIEYVDLLRHFAGVGTSAAVQEVRESVPNIRQL